MAVQFLNNIDLNNNQLQEFKVDNQTSDPTGLAGEGQLIYRTDSNTLKYHTGSNNWVALGTAGAGINNINATTDGASLTTSNTLTANGTLTLAWQGNGSTQYVDGAGNLKLISSLPQGDITGISPTDGLTGTVLNGPVPIIKVEYAGSDNIVLKASDLNGAGTPALTDSIMFSDATDSDVRTATLTQILALSATPSDATITLNTGDGFTAASGNPFTLNQAANETINFVIGAGPGIQVNSTSVQVDYTTTNNIIDSAADGTTLVAADKFIAEDLSDNIVKEYTIQKILDLVPAGDTYDLRVSAGATAGARLNLDSAAGTDTFTDFEADTNTILITKTDGVNGDIKFDLQDNVTITTSLTVPTATVSGSASNALTITGKGRSAATIGTDNNLTLATKGYVDGLVEGGLTFLGTFRADTGEILSGGNDGSFLYNVPGGAGTRVAVAVGDYYVVATAGGNFYANATYPLDIGDSIIGVETAAADTSVVGDWSLVSQGVTVNSVNTTDGTYINLTPNSATTGAVVVTADLSAVDGTAVSGTRFLSKDNTWDVPAFVSYGAMTQATLGLGRLRYNIGATPAAETQSTVANRTYGVTKNANNQLMVNVPWVDTNTVTSVDETTPGTSAGIPIVVDPTTGDVKIKSMAYDGNTKVGHVPTGGSATTFLRGDGTWVTPTDTTGVDSVTASTVANLDGLSATPTTGAVVVGLDINGLATVSSALENADTVPLYDNSASGNKKVPLSTLEAFFSSLNNTFNELIASGTTSEKFTHTLGFNTIIQLVGQTSGDTVYADVKRNPDGDNVNEVEVTFGSATTEPICALITKVTEFPT